MTPLLFIIIKPYMYLNVYLNCKNNWLQGTIEAFFQTSHLGAVPWVLGQSLCKTDYLILEHGVFKYNGNGLQETMILVSYTLVF